MLMDLPSYAELCARDDAPKGSAWYLFGRDDELGTANLLTGETTVAAAGLVKRGTRFNLDYPVNAFTPPISNLRKTAQHMMFGRHDNHRDDYLTDFYLQSTSQIDGLRHQRHPQHGFYNGHRDDDIRPGSPTLGIQHWAERGLVGRGVLLDVEGFLNARGRGLDYRAGEPFTVDLLDEVAAAAGVALRPGDILLINTGWCSFYFDTLSDAERSEIPGHVRSCGLTQSRETLEWLWDHHVAVVASDTVAVESDPAVAGSPFTYAWGQMMHQDLIPLLGICLGELWRLNELAEDCRTDNTYECMVIAKPLNLVGGVGSTANALALK